jgi:feruloyl-CoA synthase
VCADPRLHALIQQKAAPYNQQYPAGSTRITRLLLQRQPPDIDAGETTDKSYLNQRTILRRRASEVESLFAGGPDVIFLK